jgi:hypothetical protein
MSKKQQATSASASHKPQGSPPQSPFYYPHPSFPFMGMPAHAAALASLTHGVPPGSVVDPSAFASAASFAPSTTATESQTKVKSETRTDQRKENVSHLDSPPLSVAATSNGSTPLLSATATMAQSSLVKMENSERSASNSTPPPFAVFPNPALTSLPHGYPFYYPPNVISDVHANNNNASAKGANQPSTTAPPALATAALPWYMSPYLPQSPSHPATPSLPSEKAMTPSHMYASPATHYPMYPFAAPHPHSMPHPMMMSAMAALAAAAQHQQHQYPPQSLPSVKNQRSPSPSSSSSNNPASTTTRSNSVKSASKNNSPLSGKVKSVTMKSKKDWTAPKRAQVKVACGKLFISVLFCTK